MQQPHDLGHEKHFRIQHGKGEITRESGQHINGTGIFWGYIKHRFSRFKRMRDISSFFTSKKLKFRFYHRGQDIILEISPLNREVLFMGLDNYNGSILNILSNTL